ncbi:MAG TPA: DUF4097 family beta strand repeat-containing protein [Symbiobacteriaceae bacterium]|nr:DUF4097 family beta strand repeat-containing protein [Symbiobacteriaceae bacterium]
MQSQPRRPIGRLTAALTLIAVGGGLLASTFGLLSDSLVLLRLWPLLLISLGAEILVARWQGARTRFDWGGAILLVLFIALLSSGAVATRMIGNGGLPRGLLFSGSSQVGDEASFELTPAIKQVRLESTSGSVELKGTAGSTVEVDAQFWGNSLGTESPRLRLREQDGTLYIGLSAGDWNNVSAQYQVQLPAGLKIEVESGSGRIEAKEIKGDLYVKNHSGSVNVEEGEGLLDLATQSGLIQVSEHAGPIKVDAHSGAIRLRDVAAATTAHTDSGIISVTLKPGLGAQVEAATDSGLIRGPEWLQVTFNSHTAKRSATGRVGDGQVPLRLSTHSGTITIGQP